MRQTLRVTDDVGELSDVTSRLALVGAGIREENTSLSSAGIGSEAHLPYSGSGWGPSVHEALLIAGSFLGVAVVVGISLFALISLAKRRRRQLRAREAELTNILFASASRAVEASPEAMHQFLLARGVSPSQIDKLCPETLHTAPPKCDAHAATSGLSALAPSPDHAFDGPDPDAVCVICLDELRDGDLERRLPCGGSHRFHSLCIQVWLAQSLRCPVCNAPVPAACRTRRAARQVANAGPRRPPEIARSTPENSTRNLGIAAVDGRGR